MTALQDYEITDLISEGVNTVIYHAIRKSDGGSAIIKTLKSDILILPQYVQTIAHEFELLSKMNSFHVIKPFELVPTPNGFLLVMEDFSGKTLANLIAQEGIDLLEELDIAILLTEAIGEIHYAHIIHKDVKPQNILVDQTAKKLKVIDFGLATYLSREEIEIINPEQFEGSLPYISPEQTGRVNHPIDFRSDIYSLGITLYQLFTKSLPFEADTPQEMIHFHIAQKPIPPNEKNPHIPQAISDILLKCLEKQPEERYHSTFGLKKDLEKCRDLFIKTSEIPYFKPGELDVYDHFHFPEKLYGRQEELATIDRCYEEAVKGDFLLLSLGGYAGVGKSSLIFEAQKQITAKKGRFIFANFEQFSRSIPYSGWIQAFRQMIHHILSESDESLADWKEMILKSVGNNGQVIADIIPEIKLIIGEQPSIEKLNPSENQNRFHYTITMLLKALLLPEKPLVILFDNAQWADESSLKLLNYFFSDSTIHHLLIIVTYRDNEVDSFHPLQMVLNEITSKNGKLNYLSVKALPLETVQEFIQDAYLGPPRLMKELSELLFHKTQGNPFFMIQFLKYLYERELFYFDKTACCWLAKLDAISGEQVSDNVAELLIKDFERLNPKMIHFLKICAVVGGQFTLEIMTQVSEIPEKEALQLLDEGMKEDLIVQNMTLEASRLKKPSQTSYRFLHDRIQQAAYMLLNDTEKQQLHHHIGEVLLKLTPKEKIQEKCVDIVNHLNLGYISSASEQEKEQLLKLNEMAGLKAKDSAAYPQAIQYFTKGISLLREDCWDRHYDLASSLHMNLALCHQITGGMKQAQVLYDLCLNKAKTDLEKVEIYFQIAVLDAALEKYEKIFDSMIKALALLGFSYNPSPSKFALLKELLKIKFKLLFTRIKDIPNLPFATDSKIKLIHRIIVSGSYPVYVTGKKILYFLTCLQSLNLTLRYGIMPQSVYGCSAYGIIAGSTLFNDFKKSSELGLASLQIAQKFPRSEEAAGLYVVYYIFVHRWKNHLKTSILPLHEAYRGCLERGLLVYAATAAVYFNLFALLIGEKIDSVLAAMSESLKQTSKYKAVSEQLSIAVHREVCLALKGMTRDLTDPRPPELTDDLLYGKETTQTLLYIIRYHIWHMVLLYHFGKFEEAHELSKNLLTKTENFPNWPEWHVFYLYYSLTLTAIIHDKNKQGKNWKTLLKNYKQIKIWGKASPINYAHHELLVRAEMLRIQGQHTEAVKTYEEAIDAAKKNGATQEIALAHELCGKYNITRKSPELASYFLLKALHSYSQWGAVAKCNDLKKRYAEYLSFQTLSSVPESAIAQTVSTSSITGSSTSPTLDFDVNALIESSQALSKEIYLDKLMESLMHLVIVNAGADRAFLLLHEGGKWEGFSEIQANQPYKPISTPYYLEDKTDEFCLPIIKYVARTKQEVLLNNATEEGNFRYDPYILKKAPKSVLCLPLLEKGILKGILYLENTVTRGAFSPNRMRLLTHLTSQMAISIENAQFYAKLESKVHERTLELQEKNIKLAEMQDQLILQEKLKEREMLKSKFGKYVPNLKVLDLIVEKGLAVEGEEKEVTVLFCDIRNFTSLSENLSPAQTVEVLNRFFTEMVNVLTKHHGVVDKFIGDALMVLFGALEPDEQQAQHAVEAALEMRQKLKELNEQSTLQLEFGIGINTGKALLGTIGSDERMEYTAIGDSINVASRLESLTKEFECNILISENTRNQLDASIKVEDKGKVMVKGKVQEIQIYEIK